VDSAFVVRKMHFDYISSFSLFVALFVLHFSSFLTPVHLYMHVAAVP